MCAWPRTCRQKEPKAKQPRRRLKKTAALKIEVAQVLVMRKRDAVAKPATFKPAGQEQAPDFGEAGQFDDAAF